MIKWLLGIVAAVLAGLLVAWLTREPRPGAVGGDGGSAKAAQACSATDAKEFLLSRAPATWGKTVEGSSGKVIYCDRAEGAFSAKLELRGLAPSHTYVVTLNGKTTHPSNRWLSQEHGLERYVDFAQVTTDGTGAAGPDISTPLHAGDYDVKFFVKDPDDWKPVLYNDLLRFAVK